MRSYSLESAVELLNMNKKRHWKRDQVIALIGRNIPQLVLLALVSYGVLGVKWFFSQSNLEAILYQYSIIGLLALGQLLVILIAGIDLSQGSLIALTSITTASVMGPYGLIPGVVCGIAMGTLVGLVNGLLTAGTKMPDFLVTLGMMGIARGLAMQIANAKPVPILNDPFMDFGEMIILGVPISALIWLGLCLLISYFLYKRRYGRYIYAVGSNQGNARLSGINVPRVKLLVYVMSGFFTSLAGVIWTARLGIGSPIGGYGYELESIACVVVGGVSLAGGAGKVGGVVSGVLLFGVINSILNLSGISPFWQGMFKGLIIIVAIIIGQTKIGKNKKDS